MERRIVFRLDDICPQMNHDRFNKMKAIFDKYDVKPIIGIVPDCKDPTLNCDDEDPLFWEKMRDLQASGWTVAMHGCFHVYMTRSNGFVACGHRSEFAGLSYTEQYKKLKQGKDILESQGICTKVFMAPSHSYDKNTLLALNALGFQYVTDGLTALPYQYMGLVFVPCIEPKISSAKRFSTVCYHTNEAADARFQETELLLENCRQQVISFEEAKQLPRIPYWRARIEEVFRYVYKYCLIGTLWHFYIIMKRMFFGRKHD